MPRANVRSARARGDTPPSCGEYLSDEAVTELTHGLSRIEGHVGAVKRMIAERRCCDEVLTQIAAVKAALNRITIRLTETELLNCLTTCGRGDAEERLSRAMTAIGSMLKH
jgi:DNA-binding FrmR family transcriptional regulator